MSEALSKYTFLPWLRRGISTQIARTDDGTQQANAPRSMVTVGVSIGGGLAVQILIVRSWLPE